MPSNRRNLVIGGVSILCGLAFAGAVGWFALSQPRSPMVEHWPQEATGRQIASTRVDQVSKRDVSFVVGQMSPSAFEQYVGKLGMEPVDATALQAVRERYGHAAPDWWTPPAVPGQAYAGAGESFNHWLATHHDGTMYFVQYPSGD